MNIIKWPVVLLIAVIGIASIFYAVRVEGSSSSVALGSVSDISDDDIGAAALKHTEKRFPSLQEKPTIELLRRIESEELEGLGLPSMEATTNNPPPYALVIVKGDFDLENIRGARLVNTKSKAKYIGYVYDLKRVIPTLTLASPDGAIFRIALNDPSLPLVRPVVEQSGVPTLVPVPSLTNSGKLPNDGDIVLPIPTTTTEYSTPIAYPIPK